MPTAEIIAIGTELLLGETADTNTRFIARALRGLGIDLYRTQTVGDNSERIAEAVRQALGRAEIILTTGGLGPTIDDPTRQAIASACGLELEFRAELWKQIAERISRYGRAPTGNQKRQAYIPKGARPIQNPVGTAPAFIVEAGSSAVISLPGVPREMETLLVEAVLPYLQERFALRSLIKVRTLFAAGIGEAALDEQIGDLEQWANPTVGLAAHSGIIGIRITAKAGSETEASNLIAGLETEIRTRVGEAIYGADDDTLEGAALEACAARGWSLACLEAGPEDPLGRRLARRGHPAFQGGAVRPLEADQLAAATEAVRQEQAAAAALGLLVRESPGQCDIFISYQTPAGERQRHLTYGGHPANARRWGENMALDGLRRLAKETA
jgi:nicotinamide-nucleotide amidase